MHNPTSGNACRAHDFLEAPNKVNGRNDAAMTKEQLEALEARAVPSVGLAITPVGDVLVRGRHPLGVADQVVKVNGADLLKAAHAIALGALAAARAPIHKRAD